LPSDETTPPVMNMYFMSARSSARFYLRIVEGTDILVKM